MTRSHDSSIYVRGSISLRVRSKHFFSAFQNDFTVSSRDCENPNENREFIGWHFVVVFCFSSLLFCASSDWNECDRNVCSIFSFSRLIEMQNSSRTHRCRTPNSTVAVWHYFFQQITAKNQLTSFVVCHEWATRVACILHWTWI